MKRLPFLLALAVFTAPAMAAIDAARLDRVADAAAFRGVAIVGQGDAIRWKRETNGLSADSVWRLASVTKQFIALIAMQENAAGRIDIDAPVRGYWPEWRGSEKITIRMLMRHESGLADPAESKPDKDGIPEFYRRTAAAAAPATNAAGFCAENPRSEPEKGYHYNNCDFIVLGALLEKITGKPLATLLSERVAAPLGITSLGLFAPDAPAAANVAGTVERGAPEPKLNLGSYGGAGGAYIAPADLWRFDRALMESRLLDRFQTRQMWYGDPELGYAALGAWSFSPPLKGCPDPVALIERRGAIGGIQVRNFLAPATRTAVILFTDTSEFGFGEVWDGRGFAHDMLAATLCPEER